MHLCVVVVGMCAWRWWASFPKLLTAAIKLSMRVVWAPGQGGPHGSRTPGQTSGTFNIRGKAQCSRADRPASLSVHAGWRGLSKLRSSEASGAWWTGWHDE